MDGRTHKKMMDDIGYADTQPMKIGYAEYTVLKVIAIALVDVARVLEDIRKGLDVVACKRGR